MRLHHLFAALALSLALASCDDGDGGLPVPKKLRVSSTTATSITLAWLDASDGALAHRIYRDDLGDAEGFVEVGEQIAMMSVYVDSTVAEGSSYQYYVVSHEDTKESKRSNVVEWTAADPWVTVTAPTAGETLIIGNQYTITWDTNMPGFDAHILLYVEGGWHDIRYKGVLPECRWTWTVGEDGNGSQISFSTPATDCKIRVQMYDGPDPLGDSGAFTINSP